MITQETIDWLVAHGPELSQKIKERDALARRIGGLYTLYYNFPEPCAAGLLAAAIAEYKEREQCNP